MRANYSNIKRMRPPRSLPYGARARCDGPIRWLCPLCKGFSRALLRHTIWNMACEHCGVIFGIGNCFWQLPSGRVQKLPVSGGIWFWGRLTWLCPSCGRVQDERFTHTTWKVRCKSNACRAPFALGFRLWQLPVEYRDSPNADTFPIVPVQFLEHRYLHQAVFLRGGATEIEICF